MQLKEFWLRGIILRIQSLFFVFVLYFQIAFSNEAYLRISQISLFRSEVQLEKSSNMKIEVGNKILAKSYTEHKCLLIVSRISGNKIITDASQCPGFGSLKKGDRAELASDTEKNDEVHVFKEMKSFS